MEERIGRPSTYAAILETIQNRGYVAAKGKALVPTFTAFAVIGLLEKHFPRLVDLAFTAEMEETLDLIAAGQAEWVPFLRDFFLGPDGLQAQIKERLDSIPPGEGREVELTGLPAKVKIGRFGPYIEVERNGERLSASLPEAVTPDELDEATVERLLKQKAEGPQAIGEDPETGLRVFIMDGRFGPYYQLGTMEEAEAAGAKPKRASLPKGKTPADADLDEALFLLSLPKELGEHPDGGRVIVGLGRFGPYVAHDANGKLDYRSIPPAQLTTIQLDEALALLAAPKRGRGRTAPAALRDLGPHPADGQPIRVLDGRFGPYLKHGDTNATLPKGLTPDAVTIEQAIELLAERAARGPPAKKRPARRSSKKAAKKT